MAEADLVIFVGTRTDSTTTHHWRIPDRDGPQLAIQIDVEPFEIGNNYRLVAPLAGDARLALADLGAATNPREPQHSDRTHRIARLAVERDRYWADVTRQSEVRAQPIKPQQVVRAMRELLDDDATIVADPGTPTPYLAAQYELRRAGRSTIIPRAHGGLGYAIPAVVGAALGRPGSRVVGMTGDGSFGMSCGELETIGRLGLPIVIIQCSNGSFGWIKELQHLHHGDRYFSVDFNSVDYAAIARGFGLEAAHVENPDDVHPALQAALADGRPYFLNIVTEDQITETPPVAGWLEAENQKAALAQARP